MSTLVIAIPHGTATQREIQTRNGMKKITEQLGVVHFDEFETRKIRVPIDVNNGQAPYPPGKYTLSLSSFEVNNWGQLEVNAFKVSLVPLLAEVKQKQG